MKNVTFRKQHLVWLFAGLSLLSSVFFSQAILPRLTTPGLYPGGSDFSWYYTAAELAAQGHASGVYLPPEFRTRLATHIALDTAVPVIWKYPPVYLLAIEWLAAFPLKTAFVVWSLAQLALIVAAGRRFLWVKPVEALALLTLTVFFAIFWGQNSVLLAALYIAAFRFLKTRPAVSGTFFGLCIIKPHLGLLVPVLLVAGRHWRALAAAASAALALIAASLLRYGTEPWKLYWRLLTDASLSGPLDTRTQVHHYLMPSIYGMADSLGLSATACVCIQAVLALAAVVATWRLARDRAKGEAALLAAFSMLSLLIAAYVGIYDYALATTALMAAALAEEKLSPARLLAVFIVYLLTPIYLVLAMSTGLVLAPAILWACYPALRKTNPA